MPKVPAVQPGGVQTRAFSSARVTTQTPVEAFGGGRQAVIQGAGKLIGAAVDFVEKEKAKADKTKVGIDSSDARQMMNDTLKGEGGYLSQRGIQADETKEDYQKRFYTQLDSFDGKFTNDRQKELWASEKSRIKLDYDNTVESHAFRERQIYTESKLKSSVSNIGEDIVLNYQEPNKIQEGLKRQEDAVNNLADLQGLSPEARKEYLVQTKSTTYSQVIAQMVSDNNDLGAKAFFKEHSGEFTSEDKLKIKGVLEEGTVRGESQRMTDSIMEKGMSQTEALDAARNIKDPEIRDETVRRVKNRYSENRQMKEQVSQELFNNSFNIVDQDPRREAIPPDQWRSMSPSQQKILQGWIDSKARNKSINTNWTTYYDLKTMASAPKLKNKFLELNPNDYRLKLADAELKEIINLQAGLRSGRGDTRAAIDGYRSDQQVVNDTLKGAGFNLADKDQDNQKKINEIRSEVDRRVSAYKLKNGKKYIDNTELQSVLDGMLVEGTDPNSGLFGFFQTRKRAFEIEPGAKFELDPTTIPQYDRREIEKSLNKRGIPVTDDAVVELYLRGLQERAK